MADEVKRMKEISCKLLRHDFGNQTMAEYDRVVAEEAKKQSP
jgi:hypothetical protein